MQKLDIKLQEKSQEMIEFQDWNQDWVFHARYRIYFRSMADRGLGFNSFKNDIIQARKLCNSFRFIDDLNLTKDDGNMKLFTVIFVVTAR